MHRSEPSRLQSLALQLTDKVNNFVDSNERIFEMKQGTQETQFFYTFLRNVISLFILMYIWKYEFIHMFIVISYKNIVCMMHLCT